VAITDYIPHGMVTAFAGVVTYVFRQHTLQDDARFTEIKALMEGVRARQTDISDKLASNHAEILKVLLEAERQRATNALLDKHA